MADPAVSARTPIGYSKGLPPASVASQPGYIQTELGKIERASRDIIGDLTARVTATEDKLKALIAAEAKAREEGDEGSVRRNTDLTRSLKLELGAVKAAIEREESVRVTNTEAVARVVERLRASISDGLVRSRAEITDERLVRASALEALARRVESMSASFASSQGQANARIQTEEEVRASAVEAVATRTSTLETEVLTGPGALKSRIQTVESSVTNLQGTTASRLATLESEVITGGPGSIKARIANQETTFANYQGAQATINQTLSAQATGEIGPLAETRTLAASINTDLKTWASLSGAQAGASFIQALTSKFGDVTGSITTVAQTVSGLDGVSQKYGVTLNANGHVTGFQILNGSSPGSSEFFIAADKFAIGFPHTALVPFRFENVLINNVWTPTLTVDGVIRANKIEDNAVRTSTIMPGSVTNAVGAAGNYAPPITTVGGPMLVMAVCKAPLMFVGENPIETTVLLQRNGGAIQARTGAGHISFLAIDSQPPGNYTYNLFTSAVSGISEATIAVIELRR